MDQIKNIFEEMADLIENRRREQIAAVESKESERATRNAQLLHYGKEIEKLMDQCRELREQILRVGVESTENP